MTSVQTSSASPSEPRIVRIEQTESVFSDIRALAREGAAAPFSSVFADEQTRGRGQYGRSWVSAKGNIHAAVVLSKVGAYDDQAAAAALSTVIVTTLKQKGFCARLKWPNDIVAMNPEGFVKVGGVLIEDREGVLAAGIGINVNFAPSADALREAAALPAGRLVQSGFDRVDAFELWQAIAAAIAKTDPFELERTWRAQALAQLLWFGQFVRVDLPGGESVFGRLTGLSELGELELDTNSGTKKIDRGSLALHAGAVG